MDLVVLSHFSIALNIKIASFKGAIVKTGKYI